jgi:hypothetical protein
LGDIVVIPVNSPREDENDVWLFCPGNLRWSTKFCCKIVTGCQSGAVGEDRTPMCMAIGRYLMIITIRKYIVLQNGSADVFSGIHKVLKVKKTYCLNSLGLS